MNTKSLFIGLAVVAVVAIAGLMITSQAQPDNRYRDDRDYRRDGFFGQGGFLGTGVGRDRYNRTGYRDGYRYYDERRPGVVGGVVDATEEVVGGAVNTAGAAVNAINPGNWGRDRRYDNEQRIRYEREQQMRYNR